MRKTTKKLNKKEETKDVFHVDDLNDFNTQATVQVAPADDGLKDELNDIKNLLKAMNKNLDKILYHLNGGWN